MSTDDSRTSSYDWVIDENRTDAYDVERLLPWSPHKSPFVTEIEQPICHFNNQQASDFLYTEPPSYNCYGYNANINQNYTATSQLQSPQPYQPDRSQQLFPSTKVSEFVHEKPSAPGPFVQAYVQQMQSLQDRGTGYPEGNFYNSSNGIVASTVTQPYFQPNLMKPLDELYNNYRPVHAFGNGISTITGYFSSFRSFQKTKFSAENSPALVAALNRGSGKLQGLLSADQSYPAAMLGNLFGVIDGENNIIEDGNKFIMPVVGRGIERRMQNQPESNCATEAKSVAQNLLLMPMAHGLGNVPKCAAAENHGVTSRKGKAKRTVFTSLQTKLLISYFNADCYPKNLSIIAKRTGLKEQTIKVWFQNRRSKIKKKNQGHL